MKHRFWGLTLVLAVPFLSLLSKPVFAATTTSRSSTSAQADKVPGRLSNAVAESRYGALTQALKQQPFFERNDGQVDSEVLYLSRGQGYSLFLTRSGATIVFSSWQHKGSASGNDRPDYFRLRFGDAHSHPEISGVQELSGKSNYFFGSTPKTWLTQIPHFSKIRYAGVYPGIDLIFYFRNGQLEYDVAAAPGTDLNSLDLKVEGAGVSLNRAGDVILRSKGNQSVQLSRPLVSQLGNHATVVQAHYVLRGDRVLFAFTGYDRSRPLLIDPALIFSTYLTGNCQVQAGCSDNVADIAVDSTGIYLTGQTTVSSFPATTAQPNPPAQNETRTFILKLNPNASQIIYAAYLGNSKGLVIAVDTSGSAYVSGAVTLPFALSTDPFPLTVGVFSGTIPANSGAAYVPYATKLSPDGSHLLYSTLLQQPGAGTQQVNPVKLAVDSQGALYLTGGAGAPDVRSGSVSWNPLPLTVGAFQTAGHTFAMKLLPDASGLAYSTYLDGPTATGNDSAAGIAVDSAGDAFLSGSTTATGFPTTPGAFQTSFSSGGFSNAYLVKLNPTGTAAVYSTLFGGPVQANTVAYGLAIDPAGEAALVGYSLALPAPTETFCSPPSQGFIAKFNATGTGLVYLTTPCGGSPGVDAVALDSTGNAYLLSSVDFTSTFPLLNPIESFLTYPGSATGLLKLDTNGGLLWSTFLNAGSDYTPQGRIQVDPSGSVYVLLPNQSDTIPLTPNTIGLGPAAGGYLLLKIAPSLGAPVMLASPTSLSFSAQNVGAPSASADIQVGNYGDASSTVFVAVTGDFSETDNCSAPVPGGQKCDVNVAFTPTAVGTRSGTLTVNFGGIVPSQTIPLTGIGTQPALSVSPSSLSFGVQANGTTSAPQQFTVSNTGTGPLTISAVQTTAPFASTNTCGAAVLPGHGCTIQVTFAPATAGSQTGTLTIIDNAPGSPHTAPLAGNQPASFSLSTGTGSTTSTSVNPGQTATYTLSVSGTNGFSGPVSFSCSGAPANSTCSINPNPANVTSSGAAAITVTVATQSATTAAPITIPGSDVFVRPQMQLFSGIAFALALLSLSVAFDKPRNAVRGALAILILAICAGCGGGGTSSTSTTGPGSSPTPAGQYILVVTGTSGTTTQVMNLTLTVI